MASSSRRFFLSMPFVVALLLLSSCRPLGTEALREAEVQRLLVSFPNLPETWTCLEGLRFCLIWRDESGSRREAWAEADSSIEISISRGGQQALMAYPSYRAHYLRPAGFLYPSDLAGEAISGLAFELWGGGLRPIRLDWRRGWLAQVAESLASAGQDPAEYNLPRLEALLDESTRDPWNLDPAEAARLLATGGFRSSLFKDIELHEVLLPGPGPWACESALAPPPALRAGGGWSALLPEGPSLLIGCLSRLLVGLDEEGKAIIVELPD